MPPPGRSCAEQPARITRQKAATLPAVGALEAPPRRDDEQQQPGSELFEYPQQPAAVAKLKDRARRVALADGECPAETGDGPILRIMTIALILAVNDAVNELWKENADEIKKRCGPSMPKGLIDRQELFAFVLNDVLGRPLLPHDAAREVGQTGDNAVAGAIRTKPPERRGKLLKAQDAAKEAVRSAKRAAAKDASLLPRVAAAEAAGEAAIATVLTATVELKLPNATVGAKRKRVAEAALAVEVTPVAEQTFADKLYALERTAQADADAAAEIARAAEARSDEQWQLVEALEPRDSQRSSGSGMRAQKEEMEWLEASHAAGDAHRKHVSAELHASVMREIWLQRKVSAREVLLTAARARSQQLESENSRLRELLHAYMSSDGGKLVHTLDWCDAYLRGESTEGLEWVSDDSGSESSS